MKTLLVLLIGLVIGAAAVIGGYFYFNHQDGENDLTLRFTEAEIQEKLGRKFPKEEKLAGLITIIIEEPTVNLLGNDNRIRLNATAKVIIPFVGSEEIRGTFSSSVRYNQEDHTLRTADYQVESIETERLPQNYEPAVRAALTGAAKELFTDQIIHTIDDKDLEKKLTRMFLQEVKVKKGLLEVILGL